jgi:hypothetical protein
VVEFARRVFHALAPHFALGLSLAAAPSVDNIRDAMTEECRLPSGPTHQQTKRERRVSVRIPSGAFFQCQQSGRLGTMDQRATASLTRNGQRPGVSIPCRGPSRRCRMRPPSNSTIARPVHQLARTAGPEVLMTKRTIVVSDLRTKRRAETGRHAWVRIAACHVPPSTADEAKSGWWGRLRNISSTGLAVRLSRAFEPRVADCRIDRQGKKKDMLPPREGRSRYRGRDEALAHRL